MWRSVVVVLGASAVLAAVLVLAPLASTYAQTDDAVEEQRARLQAELEVIERDIEQKRGVLSEKQAERTTLERDIAILDAQIEKAQLSIRHRNLTLSEIGSDISNKEEAIGELDAKMDRSKESLAQLIRRTREIDERTLVELILSGSLSDFFADIDNFEAIQQSLDTSFDEIIALRRDLATRKEVLQERHAQEEELKRIQELEKQAIERREREKQDILEETRGEEEAYKDLIAEREQSAAQIRSALFSLRDSAAIPFGDAYDFAREAAAKTGVRPALVLAVLKQETNLGENVGQCYLTNSPNKGDGRGKNTGRHFSQVMKPTRDVDPFMEIIAELGLDPTSQVVSCPPGYGYGGAMGPAQFIPSTWMLYKDRLGRVTGESPPNPWNPRTAIFASSMLLMDNGADGNSRSAERTAALRYFAGWANASNPSYAFYGDSVMEFADEMQRQIDILER